VDINIKFNKKME